MLETSARCRSCTCAVVMGCLLLHCSAAPLLGGVEYSNGNNDDVQAAAKFAVEELNSKDDVRTDGNGALQLMRVESSTSQVVAGMLYDIVLVAQDDSRTPQTFEVKVYVPLGSQPLQLQSYRRVPSVSVGSHGYDAAGFQPVPSDSPDVQQAAKFVVDTLSAESNSLLPYRLTGIESALARRGSNAAYRLTLRIAQGSRHTQVAAEVLANEMNGFTLQQTHFQTIA